MKKTSGTLPRGSWTGQKSTPAFTLIECLLALTLFSILIVSVYSVLRSGVKAERRSEATTGQLRQIRWIVNDLSHEVQNILTYQTEERFLGEKDRLSFWTLLPEYDDHAAGEIPQLYRITYRIGEDAETKRAVLFKTARKVTEDRADTRALNVSLEDLTFSYRKGGDDEESIWTDTWNEEGEIPALIKVEVVTGDPANSDADFPFTLLIPIRADHEIGKGGDTHDSLP